MSKMILKKAYGKLNIGCRFFVEDKPVQRNNSINLGLFFIEFYLESYFYKPKKSVFDYK